ncbi:hypothetical protein GE09DRAFT_1251234 [Coniochaeta sp. 2T2.1]|nr:hypothetical protein GE09DRAFT_1251234 [Coniochaeta sp. 2T2.1]
MPALSGFVDFNPDKDVGPLDGKVIFITGGTSGLGRATALALARHNPAHIYFTGRKPKAADSLKDEINKTNKAVGATFLEMDMLSLPSVKAATRKFAHDRLDILMCNAGIMAVPPALSKDGFETQFATNHLAHGMIIQQLLPVLLRTAKMPGSDVRVVCLTSLGWRAHPKDGVNYGAVRTKMEGFFGSWIRYGQSKFANIVYAAELARRYPQLLAVSVHPGVVQTDLVNTLTWPRKYFTYGANWVQGITLMKPEQGCRSQIWVATAKRSEMVNGGFYTPVGVLRNDMLDEDAKNPEVAKKLWEWTNEVVAGF